MSASAFAAGGAACDTKGHIPMYEGSQVAKSNHHFSAGLVCRGQPLKPIKRLKETKDIGNNKSVAVVTTTYIAVPGQSFLVRCTQNMQAAADGMPTHYGARVFVDRGAGETVGEEDHFFWFTPPNLSQAAAAAAGCTTYNVRGFFETAESVREFVFKKLPTALQPQRPVLGQPQHLQQQVQLPAGAGADITKWSGTSGRSQSIMLR